MKLLIKVLGAIAVGLTALAIALLLFDFFQSKGNFPYRTFIGKVEVSGLDKAKAYERLARLPPTAVYAAHVTIEVDGSSFTFAPEVLGIQVDIGASIDRAFTITHEESYIKELKKRLSEKAAHLPLVLKADFSRFKEVLSAITPLVATTSRDATILLNEETGGYHIEAEEVGREIMFNESLNGINQSLAEGKVVFQIKLKYSQPHVTEKALRSAPPARRLAAFTTYYGRHDSPNRIHNIKLIASWLDGLLLMPGDKVSLAAAIGDFTSERGFREAYVILGGVLVPQLGGGTCQIGTTLFNALALADIKILERQNHSFYFNIYPLGRDATIYPGQKDLVFQNDTGYPFLIKAVATNQRLSFRVYGTPTGKSVKFSAPAVYLLGSNGYRPATVSEVLAADRPFRTYVTRTVFDAAGKKIKEESLASSYKLYGEKSNVPIARPESR